MAVPSRRGGTRQKRRAVPRRRKQKTWNEMLHEAAFVVLICVLALAAFAVMMGAFAQH